MCVALGEKGSLWAGVRGLSGPTPQLNRSASRYPSRQGDAQVLGEHTHSSAARPVQLIRVRKTSLSTGRGEGGTEPPAVQVGGAGARASPAGRATRGGQTPRGLRTELLACNAGTSGA